MSEDFNELGQTLRALIDGLSPNSRRKITMKIANILRVNNAKRIEKNIEPSGNKMQPRSNHRPKLPPNSISFLYPEHGSGKARLVVLSAWHNKGTLIEGLDVTKNELRNFIRAKVIRFLPIDGNRAPTTRLGVSSTNNPSKTLEKLDSKRIKSKMFKKIAKLKTFKKKNDADSATAYFAGKVGQTARAHQNGIITKRNNKTIKTPARQLLGFNEEDEAEILDEALKLIDI